MTTKSRTSPGALRPLALACLLLLPGCGMTSIGADRIGTLLKDPAAYDGRTVKVAGEVTDVVKLPFVDTRLYTVRDETGELLVVTYGTLPRVGEKVVVRGTFSTLATFGVQAMGPHLTVGKPQ